MNEKVQKIVGAGARLNRVHLPVIECMGGADTAARRALFASAAAVLLLVVIYGVTL